MRHEHAVRMDLRITVALALGASCAGCFAYCPLYATSGCLEVADVRAAGEARQTARLRDFLRDERSWVREEAVTAVGDNRAISLEADVLARLSDHREAPWVRAAAARALARLPSLSAIAPLQDLARRPETPPELELAVLEALCRLAPGTPKTAEALERFARDPDVLVAAAAAHRRGAGCAP